MIEWIKTVFKNRPDTSTPITAKWLNDLQDYTNEQSREINKLHIKGSSVVALGNIVGFTAVGPSAKFIPGFATKINCEENGKNALLVLNIAGSVSGQVATVGVRVNGVDYVLIATNMTNTHTLAGSTVVPLRKGNNDFDVFVYTQSTGAVFTAAAYNRANLSVVEI